MRLLFAIKSCLLDLDRGFHDPIRNTWAQDITEGTLRFFVGGPERTTLFQDEVQLDCPDEYHELPYKTKAILKWALVQQYDFVFLCDTDTLVFVDKLMRSDFDQFDYYGVNSRPWGKSFDYISRDRDGIEHSHPQCWPWCSGGFGVSLSRKAMEYVVAVEPTVWAEDMQIGLVLNPLYNEEKVKLKSIKQGDVALHFPQSRYNSGYDPRFGWMEEQHKANR